MKKLIAESFFINVLFIVGCSSGPDITQEYFIKDPGARVSIVMSNGAEYTGELLCVRDAVIILCERFNVKEKEIADSNFTIYVLPNNEIRFIGIREEGNPIIGIILGGIAGGAIGLALAPEPPKREESEGWGFNFDFSGLNKAAGCCIGGLLGGMFGGIVAGNIPDDEPVYVYENSEEYDFAQLNIYSRYKGQEPDYIWRLK